MKFAIVVVAVLAAASAQFVQDGRLIRPALPSPSPLPDVKRVIVNNDQNANILRFENDIGPDGSFSYGFETDNGIVAQEQGVPRTFSGNPPVAPVVTQGGFAWTSPEGRVIQITYIADENGYQPQGDAIPTPPPIPEPILRSLEYNARNNPPTIQKK